MRLLIVNADDFGMSRGVNEGVLEAHRNGIVTSASLMVNRPAAADAATVARANRTLSVGLHFDDDPADLDHPGALRAAFEAQLGRFRELLGRNPTHVDSHHHVHAGRMSAFSSLVKPLGVPLRFDGRVAYIGDFYAQREAGVTRLTHVSRQTLLKLIAGTGRGFSELGCHPARVTGELRSSYLHEREVELATLTSPGLRDEIAAVGVTLASYHDWHRRAPRRSQPT